MKISAKIKKDYMDKVVEKLYGGRMTKIELIAKQLQKHPERYIKLNLSQISKDLKIPISTVFDIWNDHIKKNTKMKIEIG